MALTSEELFQAMQIVAEEVVTGMGYDKTILCKIVDNSQRETGKYMVSDGSNTFPAYTESNYSYGKNVWVYVTIPQGNYENKKIIIGKYTGEDEAYTLHINPYSHLVDMTGPINIEFEPPKDGFEVGQTKSITQPILDNKDLSNMFLNGCNRIGLNFKVKTNDISAAVTGIYGIAMSVSYILEDGTEDSTILYTSCNDFYGPIYNFEAFFPQEMLFTLPPLKHIQSVSLQFFQDRNFKDKTGENFIEGSVILSDIQLHIGYDIDEFGGDSIMLYTNQDGEYSSKDEARERNIYLKWIKNNNGIGEEVENVPEFTTVTWYRQFIQEIDENETREHDGYWFVLEPTKWNETSIVCRPDAQNERLKVVIETPTQEALATYNTLIENHEDTTSYINAMEKQVLVSQINFTNTTDVSAELAVDLVQAVTLVPKDSYKGIYNIYGADGKINNNSDYYAKRELAAEYLSLLTGDSDYDGDETVEWRIPIYNTMIQPPKPSDNFMEPDSKIEEDESGNYYIIRGTPENEGEAELGEFNKKKISLYYRIKDVYNQNVSNNTIYCIVRKNNKDYRAQITLTFGTAGTNGTDYTLNVSLSADTPAYVSDEQIPTITTNLFDYQGEQINVTPTLDWYCGNGDIKNDQTVIPFEKLSILKVTANVNSISLESYLPIPQAYSAEYVLSGPTRIIYDAQGGNPIYEKQELKLLKSGKVITQIDGEDIQWRMIYSEEPDAAKYYPKIVSGKIQATSMFYNDLKPCGYEAYVGKGEAEKTLWIQPLLIIQNRFGNSMLNKWDGALEINDESGSILGATFAAGKKNSNNTFSGILMGQNQTGSDISTGLYSYEQGTQVFGIDETGIVKIGRSSGGQITIDGNSSQIKSSNYDKTAGMLIDMDDGLIDASGRVIINANPKVNSEKGYPNTYFRIIDRDNNILMNVDKNAYYLQTANYEENNSGLRFDLEGGGITAYSGFKINSQYTITDEDAEDNKVEALEAGTTYNFKLNTGEYTVIDLGMDNNSNFKVKYSGYMEAKAGTIGGWNISSGSLYNFDKSIYLSSGSDGLIIGGKVTSQYRKYYDIKSNIIDDSTTGESRLDKYVKKGTDESGEYYYKIIGLDKDGKDIYETESKIEGTASNAVWIKPDGTITAKTFNGDLNGTANKASYADKAGYAYDAPKPALNIIYQGYFADADLETGRVTLASGYQFVTGYKQ